MKFSKFSSIENSYRQKEVQLIQVNFPNEQFVVQEKVHGANFSFWTDGEIVRVAKRSGFLGPDENFYNCEVVMDRYNSKVLELFKIVKLYKEDLTELAVFGELYGGNYPHKDVEVLSVKTVQKGVYYSNNVEFIAFDIRANGEFVPFNAFEEYCTLTRLPYLPALKIGTFEECLNYPNEYNSTVPAMHGLPELEVNTCEGNVIRPVNTLYFGNGSRVILKNKNTKFSEKEHKKRDIKPPQEVPQYVQELQLEGVQYITQNRLKNVISKIGQVSSKDFGKVLGMLSQDVMEDFGKDNDKISELNNQDRKMLTRFLNAECGNLIRPNFLNIIDGNF